MESIYCAVRMATVLAAAVWAGGGGSAQVEAPSAKGFHDESHSVSAPRQIPTVDADGTIHVPAFTVPFSRYMSEAAKKRFREIVQQTQPPPPSRAADRPARDANNEASIAKVRAEIDRALRVKADKAAARYPVTIEERHIGGVRAHVVTPKGGVAANNRRRVLINLHGGGFTVGAVWHGLTESIPIAGVGGFKVITIDYRMAPEHRFPAASEDVAAVYRALLKEYRPKNIGLYGCSAGGTLTAMATAWFQRHGLPAPGAIGLFSAAAFGKGAAGAPARRGVWGGDSRYLSPPLMGEAPLPLDRAAQAIPRNWDYLGEADLTDPLVSPAESSSVLAQFPPTLLLTGTRAHDMSAAVQTQRELVNAGVEADLHLWDGMWHCFFLDTDLPESQEAYAVMVHFFDSHLSK